MKTTSSKHPRDTLRTEYALYYTKSSPNRFAAKLKDTTTVVLQPDVAQVFRSAEAVNDLLRSAIAATGANPARKLAGLPAQVNDADAASPGARDNLFSDIARPY